MSLNTGLFQGELVRLTAEEPELLGKSFSRWDRDSEYFRLLNIEPAMMWSSKKIKEWIEKDFEKETPEGYFFNIRTLQDDQLIGFVGLWSVEWSHGDAWVSIGIGEREYWGKGYGTDAMRLILRYAFTELNLHRVTLGVYAHNARAIRSYQKAGFVIEGCERGIVRRDGSRADSLIMGILREEWQAQFSTPEPEA